MAWTSLRWLGGVCLLLALGCGPTPPPPKPLPSAPAKTDPIVGLWDLVDGQDQVLPLPNPHQNPLLTVRPDLTATWLKFEGSVKSNGSGVYLLTIKVTDAEEGKHLVYMKKRGDTAELELRIKPKGHLSAAHLTLLKE